MIRMGNSNPEERCAFLLVNSGTQSLLCQLKQCQTFPQESWDLNENVDPNSPQNCSEMHDLMKTFFKLKNFQFRPQSFKQQSFKSYISTCSFKRTFLIWHVLFRSLQRVSTSFMCWGYPTPSPKGCTQLRVGWPPGEASLEIHIKNIRKLTGW